MSKDSMIWRKFSEGVSEQKQGRVSTTKRPPSVEACTIKELTKTYNEEGHEGETLIHAALGGTLSWNSKRTIVDEMLAYLSRNLPNEAIVELLHKQSIASGKTALTILYDARESAQAKDQPVIGAIIETLSARASVENKAGEKPGIQVGLSIKEGTMRPASPAASRV